MIIADSRYPSERYILQILFDAGHTDEHLLYHCKLGRVAILS